MGKKKITSHQLGHVLPVLETIGNILMSPFKPRKK